MNKAILAFIVLCFFSLACGAAAPAEKTAEDYLNEFGGNVDVYNRILGMTDCIALQAEFDQADANSKLQAPGTEQYQWSIGYMSAADDRMGAIGCYDDSSQDPAPATPDIALVIEGTVNAANSQTALAYSPTAIFTSTFLPTLTQPATSPPLETSVPTSTVIFVLPTQSSGGSVSGICDCSGDTLNCGDFALSGDAQACMDYCISIGRGDIHNLDGNANGVACEG